MNVPDRGGRWKKSSFSSQGGDCVELDWNRAVRDSKNPYGGVLAVDLAVFMSMVRDGQFDC